MKENHLESGLCVRGQLDDEEPLVVGQAIPEKLTDGKADLCELDRLVLTLLDADYLADQVPRFLLSLDSRCREGQE